jgi:hypothetical protein
MSYLTVEVEIDNGKIVAREPEKLPKSAVGLLTITGFKPESSREPSATAGFSDFQPLLADTWEKLGPAPEIDYDKL